MLASSPDVLKNFEWILTINGVGKERYRFEGGEPLPIETTYSQVLSEEIGFTIGQKKALKIKKEYGKFEVMIEIRNLKEEAKDEDVESGVSSDGENSK